MLVTSRQATFFVRARAARPGGGEHQQEVQEFHGTSFDGNPSPIGPSRMTRVERGPGSAVPLYELLHEGDEGLDIGDGDGVLGRTRGFHPHRGSP